MRREFLKGLGLEKDVIDLIMDENGRDIAVERGKRDSLEAKYNDYDKVVKERDALKAKQEKHEGALKELQKTHDKAMADLQINHAIETALTNAKAKSLAACKALLDLDNIELADDGTIKDLDKLIEKAVEDNKDFFGPTTPDIDGAKPKEDNPTGSPSDKPDEQKTYEDFLNEVEAQNNG